MIQSQGLIKKFGEFTAIEGLDLKINAGECFGLLGPNGAGKSTFINITYGASLRTAGNLRVLGLDPTTQSREIKKRIGVVTQDNSLDESLTVEENLFVYAAFVGLKKESRAQRIKELLCYMNLEQKSDSPIRTLSGGMKRRLVFVRALLSNPEIIILDEPTTGLDPAVRHLLWGKVKELRTLKKTILLTTHYMHEAEILCDRVAIMNKGRILDTGSPSELIQKHVPGYVSAYELSNETLQKLDSKNIFKDHSGIYFRASQLEEIIQMNKKLGLSSLQIRPSNLEDVFLKLTGRELESDD